MAAARCGGQRREPGGAQGVIEPPSGTKVWLAAGATDMCRGFDGLARQVQEVLGHDPFSGQMFVFRGRRSDLVKCDLVQAGGKAFFKSLDRALGLGMMPRPG